MPLTSDIGSRSFNLGLEVFRARIAANGRGDITVGGETVSIVYDATNGRFSSSGGNDGLNRPGFPGECFICELRLPDHRFRWKHNKLFLLLPGEYGPAFPAIVDCYTSPPT
ncbi:hypothetical protein BvCmsNSP011_02559 [Escherichia coli]|nr:hypothetical protein BvCmsNSP011_02559 [Escherichia coli]